MRGAADLDRLYRPPKWAALSRAVMSSVPASRSRSATKRPRGRPAEPVVMHPQALYPVTDHPSEFHEVLALQMDRHGDTAHRLHRAILAKGVTTDRKTLFEWRRGVKEPQTGASLDALEAIEHRYRLEPGYFAARLGRRRAIGGQAPAGIGAAEARRLAWHLPDNFGRRSATEQAEILDWVRTRILSGGTAYTRCHAEVSKHRFALQFDETVLASKEGRRAGRPELRAPARLQDEMRRLVAFKSATLTDIGYQRSGVWGAETAAQRGEHLALLFGAMAAAPEGEVRGLGVPEVDLSFALLVCPGVWDWYVQWRERRRGFFTGWEAEMLLLAAALTRRETGWLRQSPWLAHRPAVVPGLVNDTEVGEITRDWGVACDRLHRHALARAKEISRVARVHRDPFEPLLPVLEAPSPVGEYRKIADEVIRRMPDEARYPRAAAEAVRGFLMLRLGLHLGLRQKNLRQLLVRPKHQAFTPDRDLERMKRGELRWSVRDQGWEGVRLPSIFNT